MRELSERYGLAVDPDAAGRGHPGRRAAAGRDHQGARQRRQGADPRRAHRGAHPAGDRRADGHHARAARSSGTSIVFITHKLREVKAIARPDHRDPPRQGRRHRDAGRTSEAELAEMMVGRAVKLNVDKADRTARRRRSCVVDGLTVDRRPRAHRRRRTSRSRCAAGRSSASPASRATARPSWSRRCSG